MPVKTVSILGCGWLGKPLAIFLREEGFSVKGSVRNPKGLTGLSENGIEPYLIDIAPEVSGERVSEFFSSEVIFINFPPERRDDIESYHEKQIENLIEAIPNTPGKMVIFASSTSVYPNINGVVKEDSLLFPDKPSGKALLRVERLLMNHPEFDTTVIRFSGLIGYDRAPIKSIRKKKLVLNPDCPLNLIHRDDCIGIVKNVIGLDVRNTVLNATCDEHPMRREYYSREACKYGIPQPLFETENPPEYKIVSNEKLKKMLRYKLIYPNPLVIP
ncbi:MAG: SDR family oxidoreductase [Candidatus Dadabacteria bacterium]|nr:SDR family oxidoreductase [Candidatus Dadabacteria bacterium]